MNGFPNTFYGWGGEDDALVHRIENSVVYRPDEPTLGLEMETRNDIIQNKDERVEANKLEQLILDEIQWKIDGVNSLQYTIQDNVVMNERVRKLTVQLNPAQHRRTVEPLPITVHDTLEGGAPSEPEQMDETEENDSLDGGDASIATGGDLEMLNMTAGDTLNATNDVHNIEYP